MRLIDADALNFERLTDSICQAEAEDVVDDAPTIDAVEVVRCKDCHWYKKPYCDMHNGEKFNDNDFCSYGERSEE